MFSTAESAAISDRYVAVRLLGGTAMSPATRTFMERYQVEGYPSLLAMTRTGAVLLRDLPRNTEGILQAMEAAAQREVDFQKESKALGGKTDVASRKRLTELYMQRFQIEEAVALQKKVVEQEPTVDTHERLAGLLSMLGRHEEQRGVLRTMLAKFPDHAERIDWRLSLATLGLPTSASTEEEAAALIERHVAALRALLAEMQGEQKPAEQAAVRFRIGHLLRTKGDLEGAKAEFAWVVEHDPKGSWTPEALWGLAVVAYRGEDLGGAERHLETILRDHPDSEVAERARQAIEDVRADVARRKGETKPEPGEGEEPGSAPKEEPSTPGDDGAR